MSELSSESKEYLSKTNYVILAPSGYGFHTETGSLTGYALSDGQIEEVIDSGKPVIDYRHLNPNLVYKAIQVFPAKAGLDHDMLPLNSLSKAPIEVLASIWKKLGAKVSNISTVNLTEAMFNVRDDYQKIIKAFLGNNESEFTMQMLNVNNDNDLEYNKIRTSSEMTGKMGELVERFNQSIELQNKNLSIKESNKGNYFEEATRGNYMDYLSEAKANIYFVKMLGAPLSYQAELVASGQKDEIEAIKVVNKEFKRSLRKQHESIKKQGKEGYEHVYEGFNRANTWILETLDMKSSKSIDISLD